MYLLETESTVLRLRMCVVMWTCTLLLVGARVRGVAGAPAPWVARPPPAGAEPQSSHYHVQYNALHYSSPEMRARGAAYLDSLRRSLEELSREPHACSAAPCAPDERLARAWRKRGAALALLHTSRQLVSQRRLPPRTEAALLERLATLLHALHGLVEPHADDATVAAPPPTVAVNTPNATTTNATTTNTTATNATLSPHYGGATDGEVRRMIECLQKAAAVADPRPSYERCPPLPPVRAAAAGVLPIAAPASVPPASPTTTATTRCRRRRKRSDDNKYQTTEDPFQDISAISKRAPGRTINDDQVGVARTLARLQFHFANPDIERTRRFGSNYRGNDLQLSTILRFLADS